MKSATVAESRLNPSIEVSILHRISKVKGCTYRAPVRLVGVTQSFPFSEWEIEVSTSARWGYAFPQWKKAGTSVQVRIEGTSMLLLRVAAVWHTWSNFEVDLCKCLTIRSAALRNPWEHLIQSWWNGIRKMRKCSESDWRKLEEQGRKACHGNLNLKLS